MNSLQRFQASRPVQEQVRIGGAIVLAGIAALLAWLGLVWRYGSDTIASPIGAHQYVQIGAPILLAVLMVAAAWLVRGVVLARLQVAILVSLVAHLLLLFLMQLIYLPTALADSQPADQLGAQELVTLPEYGGMEAPQAAVEVWQRDMAVDTPERPVDDPQRDVTELERPRAVETPQEMPEARQEPVQLAKSTTEAVPRQFPTQPRVAIERQSVAEPAALERPAETPRLNASRPAELTPRDTASDLQKQMATARPARADSRESLPELETRASQPREARRAEVNPDQSDPASRSNDRSSRPAAAVEAPIPSDTVAAAPAASDPAVREVAQAVERQRADPARPDRASRPVAMRDMRVESASIAAARSERTPQITTGADSARITRAAAGSPRAADGRIESPQVQTGSPGETGAADAGPARFESGRNPVARTAAGSAAGSRSSASSAPASGLARLGSGSASGVGRATARDSIAASGGPARDGQSALTRGTLAGGVTGTTSGGESVDLPAQSGSGSSGSSGLAQSPAATGIGRSSAAQIPNRAGSGSGTSSRAGLGSARLPSGSPGGLARSGSSGSAGDGSAQLGSDEAGAGRTVPGLGRSAAQAGRPRGVSDGLEREAAGMVPGPQPGGTITPGPQPTGAAGDSTGVARSAPGAPSGLGRRSASLPRGFESAANGPGGTLPGVARAAIGSPARRDQGDQPQMHPLVAQIARRIPGDGAGATGLADVSPAFSLRSGAMRKEAAQTLGGTPETERAVEMGIAWLAQHQAPDGSWGIHDFDKQCKGHRCTQPGSFDSPTAATGLALLAFLGAGYTHESGQYHETVARGLKWLVGQQKSNGDLFGGETQFVRYYSHGIAAIALCEAYGMTKDPELRQPTQNALQFILDSQHPQLGGWRYESRSESDTSVSGWQLMALKSGEMAGFSVPAAAYQGVNRWLDSVERGPRGGQYAYHPSRPESLAMTAEGLLMRQYLGFDRDNPRLRAGADYLDTHLPDLAERDAYYWYYATQMMYHMQGSHWANWNGRLRDLLTTTQARDGDAYGSWSPVEPTPDRWSDAGGRLYVTCMHLLMLEVYYRHLPLYQQLER